MLPSYPARPTQRSLWVRDQRPLRNEVKPDEPYAYLVEDERSADGDVLPVATLFLTNRECPWQCVMCDLWKNTLTETVAAGAIPRQIEYALKRLPIARQIKLYNSGSFFDPRAIPREDLAAIAQLVRRFERTIVECHPSLVSKECIAFRDLIGHPLEVAMGLETAHPDVLQRLNKRMTLDDFARSAEYMRENAIDLRVFILVQPPFMRSEESLHWAERSLDFAFECGATAATLISTRGGNGAMETLAQIGEFVPPGLATVEAAAAYGLNLGKGRVFVDLWDIHNRANACRHCLNDRAHRLHQMNLCQETFPSIQCSHCEGLS